MLSYRRDKAVEDGKQSLFEEALDRFLSWDSLRKLLALIASNVAHAESAVRKATLTILTHFTVPMPPETPNVCMNYFLFFNLLPLI